MERQLRRKLFPGDGGRDWYGACLERAGDLPESTLMRLDTEFLAGSGVLINQNDAQLNASDEKYEPIFPGNQDVLHGQYMYRPDGSDIDLYRFDVDFGGADRVGLFTAETYAERLTNSSALNTNLELFRATQALATTNFGAGDTLQVRFESLLPGTRGNHFQIRFTQSARALGSTWHQCWSNSVSIDLNTTAGSESTVNDVFGSVGGLEWSSQAGQGKSRTRRLGNAHRWQHTDAESSRAQRRQDGTGRAERRLLQP